MWLTIALINYIGPAYCSICVVLRGTAFSRWENTCKEDGTPCNASDGSIAGSANLTHASMIRQSCYD